MSKIIDELENAQLKADVPEFGPGDTVVVQVRVVEGTRERLQAFEGVVIAKRNRGLNSAFTVRKISHGVGVSGFFKLIARLLAVLRLNAVVTYAAPNFITCVIWLVKRLVLKKDCLKREPPYWCFFKQIRKKAAKCRLFFDNAFQAYERFNQNH